MSTKPRKKAFLILFYLKDMFFAKLLTSFFRKAVMSFQKITEELHRQPPVVISSGRELKLSESHVDSGIFPSEPSGGQRSQAANTEEISGDENIDSVFDNFGTVYV